MFVCVCCSYRMLNLTRNRGNANQNQSEIQYHTHLNWQKNLKKKSDEDKFIKNVERNSVGTINWYNHFEEQFDYIQKVEVLLLDFCLEKPLYT